MALVLDALVFVIGAVAAPEGRLVIVGIGIAFLAASALATRVYRLGYPMVVPRAFAALVLLVAAATATALLLLVLAEVVSAMNGCLVARHARRAHRVPLELRISKRTDEVASAIIHFGFIALIALAVASDGRIPAAIGFLAWWIAVAWGTLGVHEAGHAMAARHFGNDVPEIHLGTGLTLFRVGAVCVGAIPFLGHTHWTPDGSTMTSRREALVALAGPTANLAAAAVLLAIPVARTSDLCLVLAGGQLAVAVLNLVPSERTLHGRHIRSDGAQALSLLRRARPIR
jgi:hypothetical protein